MFTVNFTETPTYQSLYSFASTFSNSDERTDVATLIDTFWCEILNIYSRWLRRSLAGLLALGGGGGGPSLLTKFFFGETHTQLKR